MSRTAINRWVNEEPMPTFEKWSERERLAVFSCVVTGEREALETYFERQQLLAEAEPPPELEDWPC